MQLIEPLEADGFYHIYNRGINGENIFVENTNYEYFLSQYFKYIGEIAETYSFCLMKNHFHFLIKIKTEKELINFNKRNLSQAFSNFFNSYTKAYNNKYTRHGSLMERTFHRKSVLEEKYLVQLIIYIHTNPVKHGFCNHPMDYLWSSYLDCLNLRKPRIEQEKVINLFDDETNFKNLHDMYSSNHLY